MARVMNFFLVADKGSFILLIQYRSCWWAGYTSNNVASFTKEINRRLAKRPLKTNGG